MTENTRAGENTGDTKDTGDTKAATASGESPRAPADPLWSERWQRLASASEAARRRRLRALTLEESIREFEALCREVHDAFGASPLPRSHPVGLIKYVKSTSRTRGTSTSPRANTSAPPTAGRGDRAADARRRGRRQPLP